MKTNLTLSLILTTLGTWLVWASFSSSEVESFLFFIILSLDDVDDDGTDFTTLLLTLGSKNNKKTHRGVMLLCNNL